METGNNSDLTSKELEYVLLPPNSEIEYLERFASEHKKKRAYIIFFFTVITIAAFIGEVSDGIFPFQAILCIFAAFIQFSFFSMFGSIASLVLSFVGMLILKAQTGEVLTESVACVCLSVVYLIFFVYIHSRMKQDDERLKPIRK